MLLAFFLATPASTYELLGGIWHQALRVGALRAENTLVLRGCTKDNRQGDFFGWYRKARLSLD